MFKIFGWLVPVIYKELDGKHDGFFSSDPLPLIEIDHTITGYEKEHTENHEALHGVFRRLSYDKVLEEDVEEIMVDQLATYITENYIKRNP